MKIKSQIFSSVSVLLCFTTITHAMQMQMQNKDMKEYVRFLQKREKRIALQNAARPTPQEQEKIDKKAEEKIYSVARKPLKLVHIDPKASHIFQVMAELNNAIKIYHRLEIYDDAKSIIQCNEGMDYYADMVRNYDEALGYTFGPSKL